LTQEKFY